ncbi:MAG: family transcriptional regulator [Marmoricola sp.]|nr:family transcriptional regulator [Marmoricola sp.]
METRHLRPVSTAPLWRDALGSHLRELRLARGETLHETASRAGISLQYLSEIERGTKDPSSEMISAVAGALDEGLAELTLAVSRKFGAQQFGAQQFGAQQVGAQQVGPQPDSSAQVLALAA